MDMYIRYWYVWFEWKKAQFPQGSTLELIEALSWMRGYSYRKDT